jgi:hypothetical protein
MNLEFPHIFIHQNEIEKAFEIIDEAIQIHPGRSHLWAFIAQLESYRGIESQVSILPKAVRAVPKSG